MSNIKIKSPNTIFTETDQSFFTPTPVSTDFFVVGRTLKGRCFVPTLVQSIEQFRKHFGSENKKDYTGIAVKETLIDANAVGIVSLGGTENYTESVVTNLIATDSDGTPNVVTVAQIYLTKKAKDEGITSVTIGSDTSHNDFSLIFTDGSTPVTVANLSLVNGVSGKRYIGDFNNPLSNNEYFYTKYYVDVATTDLDTSGSVTVSVASDSKTFGKFSEGHTPWVVSGDGNQLFRFATLSHGDLANSDAKISIANIRKPSDLPDPNAEYGLFDVIVRGYNDTDDEMVVLESFVDVSMDESSDSYIAKRIGDVNVFYNPTSNQVEETGAYDNISSYIRVEVTSNETLESEVPQGFESYLFPMASFPSTLSSFYKSYDVTDDENTYYGIDFESYDFINSLHSELPTNGLVKKENFEFDTFDTMAVNRRKFTFGFQGATNGLNPSTDSLVGVNGTVVNTFGFDFSDVDANGYKAYKRAIDILSDTDLVSYRYLSLVGLNLNHHQNVFNYAFDMAKKRGNISIIADPLEPTQSATTFVSNWEAISVNFDTSFASVYAPWYWYDDSELGRILAPQSALMLRTIALNNRISAPWYGAYGYERGKQGGSKPYTHFNIKFRDELHDLRVNTIVLFNGESTPLVMNNKTLQKKDSALSFTNVRNLLNEAKYRINAINRKYYGRPFTVATRNELASEIRQYLTLVQQDNGLETFQAIFDDSVNTKEYKDRAIVKGVLFVVPIKGLQGIEIGFVVGNSGTQFAEN